MSRLWNQCRFLAATLLVVSALRAGTEYTVPPGTPVAPNQLLVRFKTGTSIASVGAALLPGSSAQPVPGLQDIYLVRIPSGSDPKFSTQLSQQTVVEYVEPNRLRTNTLAAPNDVSLSMQYALTNIQAQQAWQLLPNTYFNAGNIGSASTRIKVAVIDTGADCTHPDFMNVGSGSADSAQGGQLWFAPSHAYVTTTIPSPACLWQDDNGHGTHTAGIVAAATNNGTGVASLGYPLELIIYKALDKNGSGLDSDIASAITAAADAGASVISMSLGGSGYSPTLQSAVEYAWEKNCVVVAAKGNSTSNGLFFPSDANYVVGVAASDQNDLRSSFSNYGFGVDIAAPGSFIYSTYNNQGYATLLGTSMSTPFVAALAGLIQMASPNIAAMAVVQRIQQSADSTYPNGGWDGSTTTSTSGLGYGRINAYRALSVNNLRTASVGGIVGQVLTSSGGPVPNATVSVTGQSVITDNSLYFPTDSSNATGLFRLTNLAAGATYTITTTASGFTTSTVKAAVVSGADTSITIVLGGTSGEFHGLVTDLGVPVPGAVVQALSLGNVKGSAVADSSGAYSLTLPTGLYDLRASAIYGVTTTVSSNVLAANASTVVNIGMARLGTFFGTVKDGSNAVVANAQISISNSTFSAGATTDGAGHYSSIGIPAGTYTLMATPPGGTGPAVLPNVSIGNDQNIQKDFFVNASAITVATNPPGLSISVDGTSYTAPQIFYWTPASLHTIAIASNPQNGSAGTRYSFTSWSDALGMSHQVTTPANSFTYTATFSTQYLLTVGASPAAGGSFGANPASSDGYYDSGTVVQLTATPNPNYQFANFTGDLSGSTDPQSISMSAPRTVGANFNVSVTVTTSPPGLSISVDGSTYTAPHSFWWASGQNHTIGVTGTQPGPASTQYTWASWSDSGLISHNVAASSTLVTYTATFNTQYLLTTSTAPAAGGSVTAGGSFYNSGTSVPITATANSGYTFANFSGDLTGSTNPQSVVMSAPRNVVANFNAATTIATNPPGLSIVVDGTTSVSPQTFSWAQGTPHTIAIASNPQNGTAGTRYLWANWSDSGLISHTVTAGSASTTYTANFSTQYLLTLAASPAAGGTVTPNPTASANYYDNTTPVQIAVAANSGYTFAGFSGALSGATNPQSVTMNQPQSITANFNVNTTVATSPAGLAVTVDGTSYTAPQTFAWAPGSIHTVAVSTPLNGPAGTHYAWASWSDSGAISHSITVAATPTIYTATFNTQYLLTLAASPGAGGSLAANPTSGDGYYNSGTSVQVTGNANAGYQFSGFSGDLSGSTNPQAVAMTAPRSVTASFAVGATVTTNPAGLSISVDGQVFTAPQTFNWTQGTNHTIAILTDPQNGPAGTRYSWANWSDSGLISHTVTAGSTPATYTANFATQYLLSVAVLPGAGGTLALTPQSGSGNYYASGASVQIAATANSGYSFGSYSGDLTGSANPQSIVMSAPRSVTANFNVNTTVATSPAGLQITVDGQSFAAPHAFAFALGSTHAITVPSPQNGPAGTHYAWASWSDSGPQSHNITVGSSPATYTAAFNTQYLLTLGASPSSGGTLSANPTSSDGYYNSGTSVQVTASANSGYLFNSFSGDLAGTTNPQSVAMSVPRAVTGNFNVATTVTTNPPGLTIVVDSQTMSSPQTFNWTPGSNHTIAIANSTQAGGSGTRFVWTAWSDSGSISHQVTVGNASATYTAGFTTQYLLTTSTSPAAGGSITSGGSYYDSGTSVPITATANSGFAFANFSGDLTGSTNPQSVVMTAPRSVIANFNVSTTIATTPPGRTIVIDGQTLVSPQTFYWTPGVSHTVAVVSNPQAGPTGTQYVWAAWSDSGPMSHQVTVGTASATYTATFKTQYLLTTSAAPPAGGTINAGGNYYDSGASVPITATPNGGYTFASFSGDLTGPTNPQSVVMSQPRSVTANFSVAVGANTVTTNPSGLVITVDGQNFSSPQTFSWAQGSVHSIAVTSPQAGLLNTRFAWSGWSDGQAVSHSITVGAAPATYTANFNTQYLLTASSAPGSAGSLAMNPSSSDGYYTSGASVQLTAMPGSGYTFANFSGDLSGTVNPQSVTVSAPRSVTANFSAVVTGSVTLDHAQLYFGSGGGYITSPQTLRVTATGPWTAVSSQPNISINPTSGSGKGSILITASAGPSGTVTVTLPGTSGSGTVAQAAININSVTPGLPFGSFDTPGDGSTGIAGAIAITGWALDNIEVGKVDIWREAVGNEAPSNGLVYIGDAVFVAGARPDVENANPGKPWNYRAGWGYLMLTNFLPAGAGSTAAGNGTFKLHAIAHGKSGSQIDLGTKTITVDNAHASRPFGTIDTPTQGGTVSGTQFLNFAWALTQNPYMIPLDGSTITVTVDGVPLGHPVYNQYRSDIAGAFPGLANSGGAVGIYSIDTTKLADGVHTIGWTVYDNANRGDGIGSRFFTVANGGSGGVAAMETSVIATSSVKVRDGRAARTVKPDSTGMHSVRLGQTSRLELETGAAQGSMVVNGESRDLPLGSSLKGGVFYWHPPAGFLGNYQFRFQRPDGKQVHVRVSVEPGFPTMLQ